MAHLARTLFASILFFLWSDGLVSGLTSSFGSNPTNVGMFVYKPTTVKTNPAVIVTIHYCTGTGDAAYFNNSPYAQFANTYVGFGCEGDVSRLYGRIPADPGIPRYRRHGISAASVGHTVPVQGDEDMK
ncbi:hypothetical protein DFH08DRAFT_988599 [Mycena albidolilacea]|uniref:Feruloyl esterase n=1 Tax=Mycena albidolilacea TaxID=1033008 RepID=A0AAD7E8B8_9AGAR|nr:hypothetical protein DFH08DRAFT_988599 [Mycena albidolilacea]